MAKVAKLITVALIVRVIVDENSTDEQMLEAAKPKLITQLHDEAMEHIEKISSDEECPFGTFPDDDSEQVNHPDFKFL